MLIKPFGVTLHRGGVCGLSVGYWKPVFITCGKLDQTVKMWDRQQCTLLWTQWFPEHLLDVTLHPSGLYAVVALASRVQFCAVYADGLRVRREYDVAGSRMTRFSTSGHAFAVIDGRLVVSYNGVTGDRMFTISGHEGTVSYRRPHSFRLRPTPPV